MIKNQVKQLNYVQTCFEKRMCDCIECLEKVDFDADHILDFLPRAAEGILNAAQGISMYQVIVCVQDNDFSSLLRAVDVYEIAEKLKMDTKLVSAGLSAVAPILLDDLLLQFEPFTLMKK